MNKKSISDLLKEGRIRLKQHKIPDRNLVTEVLLAHILKAERVFLYKTSEATVSQRKVISYHELIDKVIGGVPLAYLTGKKEFMSLPFTVNRHTLIPRPETEILVEEVIRTINGYDKTKIIILDIGTGCGNIAVSVAKVSRRGNIHIFASDISRHALRVARQNARFNKVERIITFCQGDLFKAFKPYLLEGKVDFILSNPPYISAKEYARLPLSVRNYEPKKALYVDRKGTRFHEQIIKSACHYLKKGGYLFIEIGIGQSQEVQRFIKRDPRFSNIKILPDYNKIPRIVYSQHR